MCKSSPRGGRPAETGWREERKEARGGGPPAWRREAGAPPAAGGLGAPGESACGRPDFSRQHCFWTSGLRDQPPDSAPVFSQPPNEWSLSTRPWEASVSLTIASLSQETPGLTARWIVTGTSPENFHRRHLSVSAPCFRILALPTPPSPSAAAAEAGSLSLRPGHAACFARSAPGRGPCIGGQRGESSLSEGRPGRRANTWPRALEPAPPRAWCPGPASGDSCGAAGEQFPSEPVFSAKQSRWRRSHTLTPPQPREN